MVLDEGLPLWAGSSESCFSIKQVEPRVFCIRERFFASGNRANIWLIQGTHADLIVDTGLGLWDVQRFARQSGLVGAKPIVAVATHVHFEQAGGLHQFEHTAIHELEAAALAEGSNYDAATCLTRSDVARPPVESWTAADFRLLPTQPTQLLHEGDVFDLGNRKLRVLHLPGHSAGSIALYDQTNGTLFSGGTICEGAVLDWLPRSSLKSMIASCERLRDLAPSIKKVYPGHGDEFDGARLAALTTAYIEKASTTTYRASHTCLSLVASTVLQVRSTPACHYACCCCCATRVC
eukprot:m.303819 g.303819  ORF g.303819 m.303819 type:complete len:293 (-) comp16250_c0_seq1:108-986(-)